MSQIKILMVLASTSIGGAEMYVLNLLRNMDLSIYHVDLAVCFSNNEAGIYKDVQSLGCSVFILPYFKLFNYFQYVRTWNKFLSAHHYDIVHGHTTNSASVYLSIAKKHGCITIAHCHSSGFRGNWMQRKVKAFFASNLTSVADYWYACSEKAAKHLYGKEYLSYENYYTAPNAINVENYLFSDSIRKRIREDLNLSEDVFLCGHVGSLTAPKNHSFLLDVFSSVLLRNPNSRLLLCGDGPLKTEIEEKIDFLGIRDKVILKGVVRNVNEFMMAMDVLIFPSFFEGFPITVIEAEATGLPIVLSDRITKEVDVADCIVRKSILESAQSWSETACSIKCGDRTAYNSTIANSIYNMHTAVSTIEKNYIDMLLDKRLK